MLNSPLRGCIFSLAIAAFAAASLSGQQCPPYSAGGSSAPTETPTLEGMLVFHDGMRKWFELKLDHPVCGQTSIELFPGGKDWTPIEILRGCRVRSTGDIGGAVSGYYTLDVNQGVGEIEPVGTCVKQPPFPDFSKARPNKSVNAYRVEMTVNYEPGDHPIVFKVLSASTELHPWQAYASYMLTGGFVLYGYCGEGFFVDQVFGTPEASPSHFDERGDPSDAAAYDPESAAAAGKKYLQLGYTCARKR